MSWNGRRGSVRWSSRLGGWHPVLEITWCIPASMVFRPPHKQWTSGYLEARVRMVEAGYEDGGWFLIIIKYSHNTSHIWLDTLKQFLLLGIHSSLSSWYIQQQGLLPQTGHVQTFTWLVLSKSETVIWNIYIWVSLDLGYRVLAIDYRGFADSTPVDVTETTLLEDSLFALAWLKKNKITDRDRFFEEKQNVNFL